MPKVNIINVLVSYNDVLQLNKGHRYYDGYLGFYMTSDDELLKSLISTGEISYDIDKHTLLLMVNHNIKLESEPMYDYDGDIYDSWNEVVFDSIDVPLIYHPKTGEKLEIEYKEIDISNDVNSLINSYNQDIKYKQSERIKKLCNKLNNDIIKLIKVAANVDT